MPSEAQPPDPIVLAMVICDNAHRDPGTGKAFLLGTFGVIHAATFPVVHPFFVLYLALTELNGAYRLVIQMVDVNEEREPIFRHEDDLECREPLAVVELLVPIVGVRLDRIGEYRIQVFANTSLIGERRVLAVQHGETND